MSEHVRFGVMPVFGWVWAGVSAGPQCGVVLWRGVKTGASGAPATKCEWFTWPTLRASQVSKESMMLVIEGGVTPEALFIRTLVDARRWSGSTTLLQIPELCGDIILGD